MYLLKNGHTPIYIYYLSKELYERIEFNKKRNPQIQAHYDYFNSIVTNQTKLCKTSDDINSEIIKHKIEAIIIGADAVLQHHPLLSRLYLKKNIIPLSLKEVTPDRMFPNLFWGCGFNNGIKMALMSVSCQNSEYSYFTPMLKRKMRKQLMNFLYISVRDSWTQKMIKSICKERDVPITPDPVFAFNYNMSEHIPSREEIYTKYNLPKRYVIISLFRQTLSEQCLLELKILFKKKGVDCIVLPMPDEGVNFSHSFDYVIQTPLSPIYWYSLIKYSEGYIGENMHPIVTCLHNAVPCFSIDNWGAKDILGRPLNNGSSKVEDIMRIFGVEKNRKPIFRGKCMIDAEDIVNAICTFPKVKVRDIAKDYYKGYLDMMNNIMESFQAVDVKI